MYIPLCRLPISPRYLVLIKVSIAVSVAWYANFSVFFANFGTTSNISSNSCFALASEPESIRDIGVTLFKPAHVFSTEFACNSSPNVCGPENLPEASAPTPCGCGSLAFIFFITPSCADKLTSSATFSPTLCLTKASSAPTASPYLALIVLAPTPMPLNNPPIANTDAVSNPVIFNAAT